MKDRYPTLGFITNTEDWYETRSLVQQDMMRPKSALYYTEELDEISRDVVNIIKRDRDAEQCFEINKICQEYALESVAYIFLGSRLDTMNGGADGQRLIEIQGEVGGFAQKMMFFPTWMLKYIPSYHGFIK